MTVTHEVLMSAARVKNALFLDDSKAFASFTHCGGRLYIASLDR